MSISGKTKINAVVYTVVFLTWIILSLFQQAKAQDKKWEQSKFLYTGIEASYGLKSFNITSDVPELENMHLIETGSNLGIVFGNDFSRFTIRPLGFYSATANNGRTINLFSAEAENNTYLLKGLLKKPTRFDIYSSLGINFHSTKFFGHYIEQDLRPAYNNKPHKEPFLGKIENMLITYGFGLEYRLINNDEFVHFFLTGKSSLPIQQTTNSEAFEETALTRNMEFQLGVRFGIIKFNEAIKELE